MTKNDLGAFWRPTLERNGRAFDLLVTNDGQGSCSIRLVSGAGPLPGAEIIVTARSLDGTQPRPVSGGIVESCLDDLTERLQAGEFDQVLG